MFNWWPLMWKKNHREAMLQYAAFIVDKDKMPAVRQAGCMSYVHGDPQAAQDCDAVMKAAKGRKNLDPDLAGVGILGKQFVDGKMVDDPVAIKKLKSRKRITTASKKRRR